MKHIIKSLSAVLVLGAVDVIGRFSACNLLGMIKLINDDQKIGFVAAIDVDLPDRAQSDND